ncbi:hypothetical protein GCM10010220_67500 [Streptomyces parvulus]|nr:hypothetical protein GCM10010220_67500 [Streptomyces parvulus]
MPGARRRGQRVLHAVLTGQGRVVLEQTARDHDQAVRRTPFDRLRHFRSSKPTGRIPTDGSPTRRYRRGPAAATPQAVLRAATAAL